MRTSQQQKQQKKQEGWFRSQVLPKLRRTEPLSYASIWILCSSCSFSNNFQDGCLGKVNIIMPSKHHQKSAQSPQNTQPKQPLRAKHTNLQALDEINRTASQFVHLSQPSRLSKETNHHLRTFLQPISANRWRPTTSLLVASTQTPIPKAEPLHPEAEPLQWSREQYEALLPAILKTFFIRSKDRPLGVAYPSEQKTLKLHSNNAPNLWKLRPQTIRLCNQETFSNAGWTRYHIPLNSNMARFRCRTGKRLGQTRHWFAISDAFSASGIPCRLFFSEGRGHIVAECGRTLYKAKILSIAQCLQTGTGTNCPTPIATLTKERLGHAIIVER